MTSQSMEQRLLAPLTAFENSLNTLIQSLTSTTTFTGSIEATDSLLTATTDLDSALTLLKTHQQNHAEIQRLLAERQSFEQKLKSTMSEAWRLRTALGAIHPTILLSDEEVLDQEQKHTSNPVDYQTLLSFASRIGKHNAIAELEAEKESNSQEQKTRSTPEAQMNIDELRNVASFERARRTTPYPDPEDFRKGALGRLQVVKEQHGEEAMDAEAEKLVRMSEMGGKKEVVEVEEKLEEVVVQRQNVTAQPRPPRKKVDLDFPGDDSDDDD